MKISKTHQNNYREIIEEAKRSYVAAVGMELKLKLCITHEHIIDEKTPDKGLHLSQDISSISVTHYCLLKYT